MTATSDTGRPNPSYRKRLLVGLTAGGAAVALLVGGALLGVRAAEAHPFAWAGHGPGPGASFDPEVAKERLDFAVSWVLGRLDATPEQETEVKVIVAAAADDLAAFRFEHQANREAFHDALLQTTVDRDALERIRRAEIGLADAASTRLVQAIGEVAEVLTPEQRSQLAEWIERFHRR